MKHEFETEIPVFSADCKSWARNQPSYGRRIDCFARAIMNQTKQKESSSLALAASPAAWFWRELRQAFYFWVLRVRLLVQN